MRSTVTLVDHPDHPETDARDVVTIEPTS